MQPPACHSMLICSMMICADDADRQTPCLNLSTQGQWDCIRPKNLPPRSNAAAVDCLGLTDLPPHRRDVPR